MGRPARADRLTRSPSAPWRLARSCTSSWKLEVVLSFYLVDRSKFIKLPSGSTCSSKLGSRLWGSPSSASRTGRSGAAGTGGQYACLGQYAFGVSTPVGSVRTPAGGQPRRGPWSHAAGAATCRPSRSTGGQPAYLGDLLRNGYMLFHVALLRFGLG